MPSILLDTSVAIPLRDGEKAVVARAAALDQAPYISILTAAELEGGVFRDPQDAAAIRARLDAMTARLDVIPFREAELAAYRGILERIGYNRTKVLDRLIAATALANGLALATRNPRDFREVPGLEVMEW
jgi:predicted nucleic acid-binding protein